MAREKSLDLTIVQKWLAAWDECDFFSDVAVRHLRSLIIDPLCFVVVTLGVGRQPRSLVFRRVKQMIPVPISPPLTPTLNPTLAAARQLGFAMGIRQFPAMTVSPIAPVAPSVGQLWHQTGVKSETIPKLERFLQLDGVLGPARPWRRPGLERVLRWDGADWVTAGVVSEIGAVMKQGVQVCDFQEALACAHENARWLDCEFIYTYDGSTWGNA